MGAANEFPLTKANRLKLAQAFRTCQRVDLSIDCAVQGQLGKAFVDDPAQPAAFCITVGPFWYLAGDTRSPGAESFIQALPAYDLLMPSTPGWLELARAEFGSGLHPFTRYSFSSTRLNPAHLESLVKRSPHPPKVAPLTVDLAARMASQEDSYLELSDYDSVQDFVERSFGFAALDGETPIGAAYGSLVCSYGIEVSIFVEEPYRRKGVATALAVHLLLESLSRGLRPNWDAANPESCKLAIKLGYQAAGTYDSYYHTGKQPGAA